MHPVWILLHPKMEEEGLGYIPAFLDDDDPRPAAKQFDENYRPGGGWRPQAGFRFIGGGVIHYPGDTPLEPLAMTRLKDEVIYYYRHSYVCIAKLTPNDKVASFEVARMD